MSGTEQTFESSDPWMQGWQQGKESMKLCCDGNAQQQQVVDALYESLRELIEKYGDKYGLNHDHLLHVLYPSQIEFGPVTEANADWKPGLFLRFDEYGYPTKLVVDRVYR